MYKVVIVDDCESDRRLLAGFIERFCQEENENCKVIEFKDGSEIIMNYDESFDVIFMDIEMATMDGLQAAMKIRLHDKNVPIIFTTNYVKFALSGYDVDALDYMVKPLKYFNVRNKLKKAIDYVNTTKNRFLLIKDTEGIQKISISNIYYIEKEQNYSVYHLEGGKSVYVRANMDEIEEKMMQYHFIRCRSGCIVNASLITRYNQSSAYIGDIEIRISRGMKKTFEKSLMTYYGETF